MNEILFENFVDYLRERDDVLGLLLVGSRVFGMADTHSDIDVYIVVSGSQPELIGNEIRRVVRRDYRPMLRIDLSNQAILAFDDLRGFALIGSKFELTRFDFVHAELLFDKTDGRLTQLADAKRSLSEQEIELQLRRHLKQFIRCTCRSLQNNIEGNWGAARLDAAEASTHLISCLFALEGRVAPYHRYLQLELGDDELFKKVVLCAAADLDAQREVYARIRRGAVARGFGEDFEVWGHRNAGEVRSSANLIDARHWRRAFCRSKGALRSFFEAYRPLSGDCVEHQLKTHLELFVHVTYRSVICNVRNEDAPAMLYASDAIAPLIGCLMALEGRMSPLNRSLRQKLGNDELYDDILRFAQADIDTQRLFYGRIKQAAVAQGFGHVYDAWGGSKLAVLDRQDNQRGSV